jgi:L-aspartate oxidase
MGGVRTDLDGRASLPRLYGAGEVACTGVHGANRLASNSLLEGVVFGARAGRAMREGTGAGRIGGVRFPEVSFPCATEREIRRLVWDKCGIARSGPAMREAGSWLQERLVGAKPDAVLADYEIRNLHAVALLIARCALAREESRGAHFRTDFPEKRPAFARHSIVSRDNAVSFR